DEPTGNLDRKTGEQILDLLWELKESDQQTYIVVTHDDRLAARADRVVRMEDGRVVGEETAPVRAVIAAKGEDAEQTQVASVPPGVRPPPDHGNAGA
ncbi:MAG: ABC transporter ATP-binding protein, partial [Planctomycetota bacterium]|nr:ABC transporter ATP-binding protein [Planctomycetota bacterium]